MTAFIKNDLYFASPFILLSFSTSSLYLGFSVGSPAGRLKLSSTRAQLAFLDSNTDIG